MEDLSPQAIARLAETGTRISDEALQFEVTFDAVTRQVVNFLVPALVQLYQRVEAISDPKGRPREFALGLDNLVDQLLADERNQ